MARSMSSIRKTLDQNLYQKVNCEIIVKNTNRVGHLDLQSIFSTIRTLVNYAKNILLSYIAATTAGNALFHVVHPVRLLMRLKMENLFATVNLAKVSTYPCTRNPVIDSITKTTANCALYISRFLHDDIIVENVTEAVVLTALPLC